MTFQGFSTPDKFIQTPVEFFDLLMSGELNKSEIRILSFMIRYTYGWQKAGWSLQFSYTKIEEQLEMNPQQIREGLKKLLDGGYIESRKEGRSYLYRLKLQDDDDITWEHIHNWEKKAPKKDHYENHSDSVNEHYENHSDSQDYENHSIHNVDEHYENHSDEHYENHSDSTMKIIVIEEPQHQAGQGLEDSLKTTKIKTVVKDKFKTTTKDSVVVDEQAIEESIKKVKDEFNSHLVTILPKTIIDWLEIADEETILKHSHESLSNPKIKNPVGWVTSILREGYCETSTPISPAKQAILEKFRKAGLR